MKKKLVAALLTVAMVASMAVGCGGSGDSAKGSSSSASSGSGKTLTLMASQDWVYDAEMELGKQFEEETGIKVDYQIIPADQYYNMLMTKINSGEGPDIFGGQSGSFDLVSQYSIEENGVDLSDQPWVENMDEFSKDQASVDGKTYGATYFDTTTDYYIIYNKKIFDENNLKTPTTFAEFEDVCQKLVDAGVTPIYEPAADGWHQTMWFCEIGGKYEDLVDGLVDKLNNNEINFADVPELKESLDQLNDLAAKGYFGDNYLSDEYADTATNLGSGEFAMTLAKPGMINEVVDASGGTYTADDFEMMLIPLLDNDVLNVHPCGPTRFIYSGSDQIEEAKQYLEFITTKDSIQSMIDNEPNIENLPYDVGQTPAYSDYTKNFLDSFEKSGVVFQDNIKYLNPQWGDLSSDIVSMFIGDMTSDEVLKAVDGRRATQAEAAADSAWK